MIDSVLISALQLTVWWRTWRHRAALVSNKQKQGFAFVIHLKTQSLCQQAEKNTKNKNYLSVINYSRSLAFLPFTTKSLSICKKKTHLYYLFLIILIVCIICYMFHLLIDAQWSHCALLIQNREDAIWKTCAGEVAGSDSGRNERSRKISRRLGCSRCFMKGEMMRQLPDSVFNERRQKRVKVLKLKDGQRRLIPPSPLLQEPLGHLQRCSGRLDSASSYLLAC